MWAADKTTNLEKQTLDPVPLELIEAIKALWTGVGDEKDREVAAIGLKALHDQGRWIACDCRMAESVLPLMAPAYLETYGTYYLRRLYGKTRPLHATGCVFHGEPYLGEDRLIELAHGMCPEGFFEIEDAVPHEGEHLLGSGSGRADEGAICGYTHRMRLALWRLMERARLNHIAPPVPTIKPSYQHEYAKLKDAAERLHVSTSVPLSAVLETSPAAVARRSIYAKVRESQKIDPHAPGQGFVVFMAKDIDGRTITTRSGTITTRLNVDVVAGGAPYLVMVLVAEEEGRGLVPVRAVAQPVLSGRRFFPVFASSERDWIEGLITEQYRLRRSHRELAPGVIRDLFTHDGSKTVHGHVVDLRSGRSRTELVNDSDGTGFSSIITHFK
jgi:hypothetical protein